MPGLVVRPFVRALLATGFCEGFLIFGTLAFVALHFQRGFGAGPGAAGTLVALYAVGGVCYAAVAPRALRAFGEVGLATLGGSLLVLGFAALAFSAWLGPAAAGVLAVGGGFYMLHTTVQTNLTQVPSEERGSVVALFATCLFGGQAAGLWVASRVVDAAGITPVFAGATVGLVVLTYFVRRLISSRRVYSAGQEKIKTGESSR